MHIALLTAGRDKPYALGMASALIDQGIHVDFIGSNEVDAPELHGNPLVNFLNLRGNQTSDANLFAKTFRVLTYYRRLITYAAVAKPKIFHILWNNKFELIDRTFLMLYYRLLGKRIVLTAHNVNAGTRDSNDTWLNRSSLRFQYRLADHIFVHTGQMKTELVNGFNVRDSKVTVIPFGINNTLPNTPLTRTEARKQFGLGSTDRTLLFFGNIAPYKGVEYLVEALAALLKQSEDYRLIIAGKPKGCAAYWEEIQCAIARQGIGEKVIRRIEYISDEEVEAYFKAADVLVLPYTHIFQSGVLFLGYGFGLPVIAADVGSLRDEIIDGRTGFVCKPRDSADLATAVQRYFSSDLYRELERRRQDIRAFANEQYSWRRVGEITRSVYASLLSRVERAEPGAVSVSSGQSAG